MIMSHRQEQLLFPLLNHTNLTSLCAYSMHQASEGSLTVKKSP